MVYTEGTKLVCNDVSGVVVPNTKLPNDICVLWEGYTTSISYDKEWLSEFAKVVE
jgi:hypothetical protein